MKEITIKSHIRKGKNGKQIIVKGYSRRIVGKGERSPKKDGVNPGDELKQKKEEKKIVDDRPKMSKEEVEAWDKAAREATMGYYRRRVVNKSADKKEKSSDAPKRPTPKKGSSDVLKRVEDKIANFVEKYSGKKYKR